MKNILWTGGWDSTFRICDLVIIKKISVQPFYIIDSNRSSNSVELETMKKIKKNIYRDFPYTEGLIAEPVLIRIEEISENNEITNKFNNLTKKSFMGSQYDWLARFSEENNINNLELSIHKDDNAEYFVRNYIKPINEEKDFYYALDKDMYNSDYGIFKYYHFPLLGLTKIEMGEIAKNNNFDHIMEMTWFCFNPTRSRKPCGYCNPCKYTREEGLGRRVPSKLHGKYNRIERAILKRLTIV